MVIFASKIIAGIHQLSDLKFRKRFGIANSPVLSLEVNLGHLHDLQESASPDAQQLLSLGRSGKVPMFILFPGKGGGCVSVFTLEFRMASFPRSWIITFSCCLQSAPRRARIFGQNLSISAENRAFPKRSNLRGSRNLKGKHALLHSLGYQILLRGMMRSWYSMFMMYASEQH